MTMLEVRCCCNPMKLLGWLRVENEQARAITFPIPSKLFALTFDSLTLHIEDFYPGTGVASYRAVKADAVDLGLLRRAARRRFHEINWSEGGFAQWCAVPIIATEQQRSALPPSP